MPTPEAPPQGQVARRRPGGPLAVLLLVAVTVLLAFGTRSLLHDDNRSAEHEEPAEQLSDALASLVDESQSETQRLLAASHAARFGKEAVPALKELLASKSPSKRRFAIIALGQMHSAAEPALDNLLAMVDWAAVDQSEALVNALVRIAPDNERVRNVLKNAAMTDVDQICHAAFDYLSNDAYSKNSIVIELLTAEDPSTQVRAIKALPAIRKSPDAEPHNPLLIRHVATILEGFLSHESADVRIAAFHWLNSTGHLTNPLRLAVLNGPDQELYSDCMLQFGNRRLPATEAIRTRCFEILADESIDVTVRDAALRAFEYEGFDDRALRTSVRLIFEEGLTHYDQNWPFTVWDLYGLFGRTSKIPLDAQIEQFQQAGSPRPVLLLSGQLLTTDDMERLAALTHLKVLAFFQCQLPPGFLQRLSPLTDLRALVINSCDLTDEDLTELPAFPALTHLSLNRNLVSPESIPAIKRQTRLTHLDVMDTAFPQEVDALPEELRKLRSVLTRQPR